MSDKDCELNYFAFKFWNGIMFGFGWHSYPEHGRRDFIICLPFMQFAWVKQMATEDEAEKFLDENDNDML